jgi:hypothetical protein
VRGEIHSPEAYARGKMLDHSGWAFLPRNITPSDLDMVMAEEAGADFHMVPMVIDNDCRGRILLVELSSYTADWEKIPAGQFLLYQNLVKAGRGVITAALAAFVTPNPGQQIDTLKDICSFSVLFIKGGMRYTYGPITGHKWRPFVTWWFQGGDLKMGNKVG